jgi:chemotaxis protein methyltransferase CheR
VDALPADILDGVLACVYEASMITCKASRRPHFARCVAERMTAIGCRLPSEYLDLLGGDGRECIELIDRLTTKETHFFRLPGQFRMLVDRVLPEIEERKSEELRRQMGASGDGRVGRLPFAIWSAGCATGEEAYSLAMAAVRGVRFPRAWDLRVHATDISESALRQGLAGVYPPEALRSIPAEYHGLIDRADDGSLSMAPSIRRMVSFHQFNLGELPAEGLQPCRFRPADGGASVSVGPCASFDIVFCRNVMIYFDGAAQERLVAALHRILAPGGYLFTGDAELLHIYDHPFETVRDGDAVIYRKKIGTT